MRGPGGDAAAARKSSRGSHVADGSLLAPLLLDSASLIAKVWVPLAKTNALEVEGSLRGAGVC